MKMTTTATAQFMRYYNVAILRQCETLVPITDAILIHRVMQMERDGYRFLQESGELCIENRKGDLVVCVPVVKGRWGQQHTLRNVLAAFDLDNVTPYSKMVQ